MSPATTVQHAGMPPAAYMRTASPGKAGMQQQQQQQAMYHHQQAMQMMGQGAPQSTSSCAIDARRSVIDLAAASTKQVLLSHIRSRQDPSMGVPPGQPPQPHSSCACRFSMRALIQ